MRYLSLEDVLYLHEITIQITGGKEGIHDFGLLHSAVERPKASFGGKDLYPNIFIKTAALVYSLINNHPFVDGNKRTAVVSMGRMLKLNGKKIEIDSKELVRFALRVESKEMDIEEIANWLKEKIR